MQVLPPRIILFQTCSMSQPSLFSLLILCLPPNPHKGSIWRRRSSCFEHTVWSPLTTLDQPLLFADGSLSYLIVEEIIAPNKLYSSSTSIIHAHCNQQPFFMLIYIYIYATASVFRIHMISRLLVEMRGSRLFSNVCYLLRETSSGDCRSLSTCPVPAGF